MTDGTKDSCSFKQLFRWYATNVETGAAELVPLDQANIEACSCSIERSGVSCRSTADDNEIMMSHMSDSLARQDCRSAQGDLNCECHQNGNATEQ